MLGTQGPGAADIGHRLPVSAPARAFLHLPRLPGAAAWRAAQRHQGAYPSVVSDPMLGRPSEVDALNGEVARIAARTGGDASVTQRSVICCTRWSGSATAQRSARKRLPRGWHDKRRLGTDHKAVFAVETGVGSSDQG